MHGLLTYRKNGQFSKRVRRLAHLDNANLSLRPSENCPPELLISLLSVDVHADTVSLSIWLTSPTTRLRLYAHSRHKFGLWARAFTQSSKWCLHAFYTPASVDMPLAAGIAQVRDAVDLTTGKPVCVKHAAIPPCARPRLTGVPRPPGEKNTRGDTTTALAAHLAREVRIARVVAHANVIAVRDVFVTPVAVHIVWERTAHTLQCALNRHGALPERVAARLVRGVLAAVCYLHGEGIVHRDVQPRNFYCVGAERRTFFQDVLRGGCGQRADCSMLLLGDFSVACFVGKRVDTRAGRVVGGGTVGGGTVTRRVRVGGECTDACGGAVGKTEVIAMAAGGKLAGSEYDSGGNGAAMRSSIKPLGERAGTDGNCMPLFGGIDGLTLADGIGAPSYMAPEMVRGDRYGTPVDVWAVGVVLFYMLSGGLPFCGESVHEIATKVLDSAAVFRWQACEHFSKGALAFLKALLHPDARKRLTAESALENEWLVSLCGS